MKRLYTYGVLSAWFLPDNEVFVLFVHRKDTQRHPCLPLPLSSRERKALTEMNLHLDRVLSPVTGVTGMRIIRAILEGERDPEKRGPQERTRGVKNTPERYLHKPLKVTVGKNTSLHAGRLSSLTSLTAREKPATGRSNATCVRSRSRSILSLPSFFSETEGKDADRKSVIR